MIEKLVSKIDEKNAPVVVGLDPSLDFIPDRIKRESFREYGQSLEGAGDAIYRFNKEIIDHVSDLVPAVKLQSAMYEKYGLQGLFSYKKTIEYAKKKGLFVIGDIKRGDIGNTSRAYAEAHLGKVKVGEMTYEPYGEDFSTVNPYLGSDGVRPFIEICKEYDKGIFVLVKTSNPSSGEFQDRLVDGRPLYEEVAGRVEEWGKDLIKGDFSEVGAVAGATYPEVGKVLREIMPHAMILVPGYGAQGGKGEDLKPFFNKDGRGAIVNSSRGIIAAWKKDEYKEFKDDIGMASRQAVIDMKEDILNALLKKEGSLWS